MSTMKDEAKQIIKLTTKEILLTLFDVPIAALGLFDSRHYYRKSIDEYLEERSVDRISFNQSIQYLRRRGLIRSFLEGNKRFIELTQKGLENYQRKLFENIAVKRPPKWDGLFRLVIFDIPEDKKTLRDLLRKKLESIGFRQVQKSVFVYPFECKQEIETICAHYTVSRYLKYMVAEIIEGEEEIIDQFLINGTLELQDLDTR